MSGPIYELVEDTLEGIGQDRRGKVTRSALTFLPENLYIKSQEFPEDIVHVLTGSGMGHVFSGEVADVAFYNKAEKSWACVQSILDARGVKSHLGFTYQSSSATPEGVLYNSQKASNEGQDTYFKIKIEAIVDKS